MCDMKSLHFIQLLISCDKIQAKALLETADKQQVEDLCYLLYNLFRNLSILPKHCRVLLEKNKKLFNHLFVPKLNPKSRYLLIRRNWIKIRAVLFIAKGIISKQLS